MEDVEGVQGRDYQQGTFAEWYALRLAGRTMRFRSGGWNCVIFSNYLRWWMEGEDQRGHCPASENAEEMAARLGFNPDLPGVFLVQAR